MNTLSWVLIGFLVLCVIAFFVLLATGVFSSSNRESTVKAEREAVGSKLLDTIVISGKNQALHFSKIEIYDVDDKQLGADDVKVAVSSSLFTGDLNDIFNGTNTRFAFHTDNKADQYIAFTFAQRRIKRIVVTNRKDCCKDRLADFTLYCKLNGITGDVIYSKQLSADDIIITTF